MALTDHIPGTVFETEGGIEYTETDNSMKLALAGQELTGSREFIVQWEDRYNFIKELVGSLQSDGNDPERFIRTPPGAYPDISNLVCISTDIAGFGAMSYDSDTSAVTYDLALVRAAYVVVVLPPGSSSEKDQVLETREIDYQPEVLQYGALEIEWNDDNDGREISKDIPLSKLIVTKTRTYTRQNLSRIPEASINDTVGKINVAAFDGMEIDKLLFLGATTQKTTDTEGKVRYEATYQFAEAVDHTWDQFWDPVTETWRYIRQRGGIQPLAVYEPTSFDALFTATA